MSRAPSYTSEPGPGERRLAIALQGAHAPTGPLGTFIQRGSGIDIALYNQQEDARRATYARNASVAGEVSLSTTHGITSVKITLEGKAKSSSGGTTRLHEELLNISFTLWDDGNPYTCPSVLPFNFVFPESFADLESGTTLPLPPSYDSGFAIQDMRIRCVYEIFVQIVRSRWVPNKSMFMDIDYAPRTLPAQIITDTPFPFFDMVKAAPEEWHQMSAMMPSKPRSVLDPVHCNLFIPAIRVFTKRDDVPFFLQLRGTTSSMMALYGSGPSQSSEGIAHRLLHIAEHTDIAPRINVTIKRQVNINTAAKAKMVRTYTIGTGSLRSVPPGYIPYGEDSDSLNATDDYEGDIRFVSNLSTSSFNIRKLSVTDFVVLSIEPQKSAASHFDSLTQAVSVRIVTG
ncbi:hypothetical protein PENSPDRAFT_749893 [Peniophora sp. CONT]|nr:hypothetical protein PENSPDRAFT_749893 [Peniophora sp. CONT]